MNKVAPITTPAVQKVPVKPQPPTRVVAPTPPVEQLPPVAMPLEKGISTMLKDAGVIEKPKTAPVTAPKKYSARPTPTPRPPQRPVMAPSPEQLANAPLEPNEVYSTLRVRAGQEYLQKKGLVQYQQKQRLQQIFEKPVITEPVTIEPAKPIARTLVEENARPFLPQSSQPIQQTPQRATPQKKMEKPTPPKPLFKSTEYKSPPRQSVPSAPVVQSAPLSNVAVAPVKRFKKLNVATIYFAPESLALNADDTRILAQVTTAYRDEGGGTIQLKGMSNSDMNVTFLNQQLKTVENALAQTGINKNFIHTETRIKKPSTVLNPAEIPTSSTHLFNRVEIWFE
jgi:hypothetical protein